MSRVLEILRRVRAVQREEASARLAESRDERDRQANRVGELVASIAHARQGVDGGQPGELATWSAWRLHAELGERRERARLGQKERELEATAALFRRRLTDELVLERVVTERNEAEAEEQRRAEVRTLDEVASRRAR